jgi:hypothetical protein
MNRKAFFTIVTKSHLAYARALALQLKKFHGSIPFYVFLADHPDGCFDVDKEPFHAITLEKFLPAGLLSTTSGYYTAYELSNTFKPHAHLFMSKLDGIERWLHLDADLYITSSLDSLFRQLEETSIMLMPHLLRADVVPVMEQLELSFLRNGIYNGGCVGINKSPLSLQFLNWWRERMVWFCLHNSPGLEAEQTWLNFVPSLFPDWKLVRDPGSNVAYWNIHERPLEINPAGGYIVQGHPVTFLHFSGWDWRNPELPTRHYQIELGSSKDAWIEAARTYSQILQACEIEICSGWPYSFAKAKNGMALTPSMRRNYLEALRHKNQTIAVPSIFDSPENYIDPAQVPPTIWSATKTWLRAVKRNLLNR